MNLNSLIDPVRDSNNTNIVVVYTERMGALTYTLTATGIKDATGNPLIPEPGKTANFTGMAAVTVESGPVGNTINGIGNIDNEAVTTAVVFNNRIYIATKNKTNGANLTEVHASDETGVYFTLVNSTGFRDAIDASSDLTPSDEQAVTASLVVYDHDGTGGDPERLWASTGPTPADDPHIYYTDGSPPHTWVLETPGYNWGSNKSVKLYNYGIQDPSTLYTIRNGNLEYRNGDGPGNYLSAGLSGVTDMIAFGGRLYVAGTGAGGIVVYRSYGPNVDKPTLAGDYEKVLDSVFPGTIGMNDYDDDDPVGDTSELHYPDSNNTGVTSMAVFSGYVYIGTVNAFGPQIWRSQDGLTWERVLDFGNGTTDPVGGTAFGGLNDLVNTQISSMVANGNYLHSTAQFRLR